VQQFCNICTCRYSLTAENYNEVVSCGRKSSFTSRLPADAARPGERLSRVLQHHPDHASFQADSSLARTQDSHTHVQSSGDLQSTPIVALQSVSSRIQLIRCRRSQVRALSIDSHVQSQRSRTDLTRLLSRSRHRHLRLSRLLRRAHTVQPD